MNNCIQTEGGSYRLTYGTERISFYLSYAERKRLSITVHPDLRVSVIAPKGKPLEEILLRVKRRAPWILKQRDYFESFHPLPPKRQYVSGETHYYLGRQYRLKILNHDENIVKLIGRYFHIYASGKNPQQVKQMLNGWYKDHAKAIFLKEFDLCYDRAKKFGVPRPQLRIRKMLKRWGSCSNARTITLNIELIKAPLFCIDYVIMHELCHLKIRDHRKGFYRLLSKCIPDWELRKARLEKVVI